MPDGGAARMLVQKWSASFDVDRVEFECKEDMLRTLLLCGFPFRLTHLGLAQVLQCAGRGAHRRSNEQTWLFSGDALSALVSLPRIIEVPRIAVLNVVKHIESKAWAHSVLLRKLADPWRIIHLSDMRAEGIDDQLNHSIIVGRYVTEPILKVLIDFLVEIIFRYMLLPIKPFPLSDIIASRVSDTQFKLHAGVAEAS